jgi:regulator of cell morphogenesis and NO signaling
MYPSEKIRITEDMKVSDAIISNPYLLLMLGHFGIGMPLMEKTVADVCKVNNINIRLFIIFANLYNGIDSGLADTFSSELVTTIVEYLKNSHKYYEEKFPDILSVIKQMEDVNSHKEMALVENFFNGYFDEVKEHLDYENQVVFPYITSLYEETLNPEKSSGKIKYSVSEYRDHHNDIEGKLNDLKSLLIRYLPEGNDTIIRRKLLFSLIELEYDLNIHSRIEDLILIPLVSRMELSLNK